MFLQRLAQFAVVAEEGSIIGAASRLHVAQPALSRQMRSFEDHIGVPLLVRERRGVRLTPAGEALVAGERDIFARLELLVRRTQEAHSGVSGSIRLGVARMAIDSRRMTRAIALVRERLPGIRLSVAEVNSPDQARALRSREQDVTIGLADSEGEALLKREVLFELPMDGVLLGTSHPLALRGRLRVADLRDYPFLRVRTPLFGGYPVLTAALTKSAVTRMEEHETVDGIYTLIAAGHGWTMGSRQLHANPPPGTKLVPVEGLRFSQPVMLLWRGRDRSRALMNVVRLLKEGVGAVADAGDDVGGPGVPLLPSPQRAARRLELGQLEAVVAAVEERSLSVAAERLRLTQSGVSRRVHAAEETLGCRLIERAMHGVVPTNAGETLRHEARELLRLVDGVVSRARQLAHGVSGECRTGTLPPELTGSLQIVALRRVFEENPQMRVEVIEMLPDRLFPAMLEHRVDIGITGIVAGMRPHPRLSSVMLVDDVIDSVLLAEQHPLAARTWLRPEDLATEPFMFIDRVRSPRMYDTVVTGLSEAGFHALGAVPHSGPRAIWRALTAGRGWTIATRSQRGRPPEGLVAVPVEGLAIQWGVGLVWRRDEREPCVLRVLEVFRTTRNPAMAIPGATLSARSSA